MTATLPPSVIEFFEQFGLKKIEASENDIRQRDGWRKVHLQLEGIKDGNQFVWNEKDEKSLAEFIKDKWDGWENLDVDGPRKVIVFVNTVDRALRVYSELKNLLNQKVEIILAHSRFTKDDRMKVENKLSQFFGKKSEPNPAILVTTQVAEAGLNISAPLVITELCPMDSLIQRAGRCQRFRPDGGEELSGKVIVVKPAGKEWYVPYIDRVRLVKADHGDEELSGKVKADHEKKSKRRSNPTNQFPAIEFTQRVLEKEVENRELLLDWQKEKELIEKALDRLYRAYLSAKTDVEFSEEKEPYISLFKKHKREKEELEETEGDENET
jgi:CRISPR/Cas system-associated endonuclease/helicase Cas3